MLTRSPLSLAAVILVAALFAAGPVRAEGPLQAPDPDFDVHYRIPPFLLDTTNPGQCLRVFCWSASHDVSLNFALWDDGPDPSRVPIFTAAFALDATNVARSELCPPNRNHPAVGRITASRIKKLSLECSAEVFDPATSRTLSTLQLVAPPKRKKR